MGRKKKENSEILTNLELEVMTALWSLGCGGVRDVMEALPSDREFAYTTVSTVLRVLEKKEVVASEKEGRGHVYVPLVTKESYESKSIIHVVNQVFDGTPLKLVQRLIDSQSVSPEDLAEIRKMLDQQ